MTDYEHCKDFMQKRVDEINAERKAEKKEKEKKLFNPIERIERKLDAIIDWINWFAKENSFYVQHDTIQYGEGKFRTLPTIDIEDCEQKDKDSE